jgi:threonine aldolase
MRYISAQMSALYGSDLWIRNALQANDMAERLAHGLADLAARHGRRAVAQPHTGPWADSPATGPLPRLVYPAAANALFVQLPPAIIDEFREAHFCYVSDVPKSIVRLMCGWDTTIGDIDALLATLDRLMGALD